MSAADKDRPFDARQLMQKAVDVMRQSLAEPRRDGKHIPKVGTVLWKPDGTIQTAFRGELRDGDHAEFTLLERKNRDKRLDNCVLFATLEPCAPDSRHPPKMSCAERIVLARIKQVWVGVEDPDPTVDRKGIKYLEDNGVQVRMFDHDLQEQILQENKDFFAQALERAAAAAEDKKPPKISLSALEKPADAALLDLSDEALSRFVESAGINAQPGSADFQRRLVQMGLLDASKDPPVPTGFGLLLFGKEPRIKNHHAGLLATIHYPDGTEEIKDFDGPTVLIPEQALAWLKAKLPSVIDRAAARRRHTDDAL
ncbi:MAG: hypothetical protein GX616_22215, partial [Planctomycetes bacterium]|nr:hypothetical protein [Planctomycetota bacterium]